MKQLQKYEMSCLTTAELAQFDQATYVAKWLEANDVDAQRKVLSQLCSHGLIDQIRIVITAGFNPNVHNFRPVIGPSGRHVSQKHKKRQVKSNRKKRTTTKVCCALQSRNENGKSFVFCLSAAPIRNWRVSSMFNRNGENRRQWNQTWCALFKWRSTTIREPFFVDDSK